ncbi:MAG: gamma-glutamyltransferase [Gammaproteobacteria bacterium]
MSTNQLGVVSAGHRETANAAEQILLEGGNAFDAIVAAHFCACVAEPVLASLGGGGFLLAHTESGDNTIYDFFVQTPLRKKPHEDISFYPITADFGGTQQTFHIGPGSIATPGTVKGLFLIHKELCSMPITEVMQPAIDLAKNGVVINSFQAYIFEVVSAIYSSTPESFNIFKSHLNYNSLVTNGEKLKLPLLANTLEALARKGEALFYSGELAQEISDFCSENRGHLTLDDLRTYKVQKRKSLSFNYKNVEIYTNPPPSSGGILIAFALNLLEKIDMEYLDFGGVEHLTILSRVMELTNKARLDTHLKEDHHPDINKLLDPDYVDLYRRKILRVSQALRGTSHINVIDRRGNIACMSMSNGEGCGHLIPDSGIMLNNMLGEEDLNPHGFQFWTENQRMTSMMSPSLVFDNQDKWIALGSGGSNRIRTAILQVIVNLIDHKMSIKDAIEAPRIHFENDLLNIEHGFNEKLLGNFFNQFPEFKLWQEKNLYFGGTHAAVKRGKQFSGFGDPRRGGVSMPVRQ